MEQSLYVIRFVSRANRDTQLPTPATSVVYWNEPHMLVRRLEAALFLMMVAYKKMASALDIKIISDGSEPSLVVAAYIGSQQGRARARV
jgi:hypothetical protein